MPGGGGARQTRSAVLSDSFSDRFLIPLKDTFQQLLGTGRLHLRGDGGRHNNRGTRVTRLADDICGNKGDHHGIDNGIAVGVTGLLLSANGGFPAGIADTDGRVV